MIWNEIVAYLMALLFWGVFCFCYQNYHTIFFVAHLISFSIIKDFIVISLKEMFA